MGLFRLNPVDESYKRLFPLKESDKFFPGFITAITTDHSGSVFFSMGSSLMRMDPNSGEIRKRFPNHLYPYNSYGTINEIVAYEDEIILATEGGLIIINKTTGSSQIFRHNALNPNSISADWLNDIILDNKQTLWICGTDGFSRLNLSDEFEFLSLNLKILGFHEEKFKGKVTNIFASSR